MDSPQERHELIQGLQFMVAGGGDGLEIEGEFRWEIENLFNPIAFFDALPLLLPDGANLYFEGVLISQELGRVYKSFPPINPVPVARDTISPPPQVFHCAASLELITQLKQLVSTSVQGDLFDHIKGYVGSKLLFTYHDAFSGVLILTDQVSEQALTAFSNSVGHPASKISNSDLRPRSELAAFLNAIQQGNIAPTKEHSWWSKLWHSLSLR